MRSSSSDSPSTAASCGWNHFSARSRPSRVAICRRPAYFMAISTTLLFACTTLTTAGSSEARAARSASRMSSPSSLISVTAATTSFKKDCPGPLKHKKQNLNNLSHLTSFLFCKPCSMPKSPLLLYNYTHCCVYATFPSPPFLLSLLYQFYDPSAHLTGS
jgi:hypothetical protein